MEPEDKQFLIEFGILVIFATIFVIGSLIIVSFIFFYGNPLTIVVFCIMLILRIKICDTGTEISLIKILRRYFKISITFMK